MATVVPKPIAKRHKWFIDLSSRHKLDSCVAKNTVLVPTSDLPSPPGFLDRQLPDITKDNADLSLVDKQCWNIAVAPMKQLPMNLFLMYMSGNIIGIFSIMMVGMMFFKPVQALLSTKATFGMLEGSSHCIVQKMVYVLGNLLALGLALFKCQSMGLLPTHASDWLDFIDPLVRVELSGGGFSY